MKMFTDSFKKLLGHGDEVEELQIKEFDPRGQYKGVLEAVRKAIGGREVKVFRAGYGRTRAEYYVVGVEDGKLVGLKAKAVET